MVTHGGRPDRRDVLLPETCRVAKKKRRKLKVRTDVGMRPYANRVKTVLKDQGALPRFRQDLSIIDDLARLAWHVPVLERSLRGLVAGAAVGGKRRLDERLGALAADVERVLGLCRSVRGPLRRLLKARPGSRPSRSTLVPFTGRSHKSPRDDARPDAP